TARGTGSPPPDESTGGRTTVRCRWRRHAAIDAATAAATASRRPATARAASGRTYQRDEPRSHSNMPVNQALGSQCVTVLLISDGLGNRQTAGQSTTHDSRAKQKANCRNAATAASTRGPA